MSRLTKRIDFGNGKGTVDISNEMCGKLLTHEAVVRALFEKLAHYEDLEEQGLLLKLPCKVGDVVYVIAQAFDMENNTTRYKVFIRHIDQIRGNKLNPVYFVTDGGDSFVPSSIGNRVFLTKEEAERELERLKSNE